MEWDFLTTTLNAGALLLDCRSEENYAHSTLENAHGAAFIKKPYGSGARSMQKLQGYLEQIQKLTLTKEKTADIIAFDEGAGMYASRMTWLLRGAGFTGAKMLSMKFPEAHERFSGKGRGQIKSEPAGNPAILQGIVSIAFVQQNLTRAQLLDVRTPNEYNGISPRMQNPEPGSYCGRIPGSINWDWRGFYRNNGQFKSRRELTEELSRIRLIKERITIIYDYNGARSCTAAMILGSSGYRHTNVYLGSWMEWRKSHLPKQNLSQWFPGR